MKLFEVFDQLKVEERLRNTYQDTVVDRITASKQYPVIQVHLKSGHLIKPSLNQMLETELGKQYFYDSGKKAELVISYELEEFGELSDAFRICLPYFVEELALSNHLDAILLEHPVVTVENNKITLTIEDSAIARGRSDFLAHFAAQKMKSYTGLDCQVLIAYSLPKKKESSADANAFDYDEFLQKTRQKKEAAEREKNVSENKGLPRDLQKPKERPVVAEPSRDVDRKSQYRARKLPQDPEVFYGRAFDGEIVPISEIVEEMGEVVIHGKIIKYEDRDIRGEKKLISIAVTDYTDTIGVKLFVKQQDYEDLTKELQPGHYVKLKGMSVNDKFDHEISISSVIGIRKEKTIEVKRMDNAPVKRVELHCHTQMSEMDSVVDTHELVKTAFNWGLPGIAITDHGVVQSFVDAFHTLDKKLCGNDEEKLARLKTFKLIYGMEGYIIDDEGETKEDGTPYDLENDKELIRKLPSYHIILLAKNDIGRINLYRLVSMSHLDYFYRRPKIPKSLLRKYREGIIIGSACEAGELFRAILHNKPEDELKRISDFYDYYEIQPIGNNAFMLRDEKLPDITRDQDLIELNKKIVYLAEEHHKLCVATCDVHFLNPEDEIYRRIIMAGKGFDDADLQPPLYLRTTEEMLDEFKYLPKEKAEEIVITNTNAICDMIDYIEPVRPDKCPPVIDNSDQELTDICYKTAHSWYGEKLPIQVTSRLEKELNSIIKNGFAVMYIIAERLVKHSNEDGYLVGSRGSVGSSFVATMSGITEVNPLPSHYYCKKCHFYDFDSPEVKAFDQRSGFDMPDRNCPQCGSPLTKDGHNIPFETFLGFNGDKEPDIDLNFSGDYQANAHAYTEVLFGKGHTFRAGTVGTLADKTAFGYIKKYYEERNVHKRNAEIDRIVLGCVGVKRTTGQHPGGIVVLPHGEDINSFTPVQHPANDMTTSTITTHFDYHKIDHNLLKLDILGHDDPTMIRFLEDLTGIDAKTIPMDDPKVVSLFKSTEALGIRPEDIDGCDLGSLGVPELGTDFVMQMLRDTKPSNFSDMIRISGLSHGTDVWIGNTQTLIEEQKCTLSTAICTRDDIMTYLIHMGVENGRAFKIMESVRKGKGLTPEMEEIMLANNVPDWYIWSCKKIKYMFPKAHAAAYVMMAFRIAYFKVYYPQAYYAAYFSIRAKAFSYELMCMGKEKLNHYYQEYKRKDAMNELGNKEKDQFGDMHIVQEMYARGLEFLPIDLYESGAKRFKIVDGKLLPSFISIDGLGETAANQIVEGGKGGKYLSKEDFGIRCHVGKSTIDLLDDLGLFGDMTDSNQMDLSSFLSIGE